MESSEKTNITLYSNGIKAGDFIYVSGQVPISENGTVVGKDITEQTKFVLEKIDNILKQFNASLENVINITVYLTDIKDFMDMNNTYIKFFKYNPPTRVCFEVSALAINAKIEISAIAYHPEVKEKYLESNK